jgi:hypothetical protein
VKGVVFNVLEEVVTREHGDGTWDRVLQTAGLEGAYTSLGSYPDQDLADLVTAAAGLLDAGEDDVVRWFGRAAIPVFAASYPELFEPHDDTRSFVLTLNEIIHPEVRKLYPGADVPEFDFEPADSGGLVMIYRSPRRLCSFAEGLLSGAADHYGERVAIEHPQCLKRGDDSCRVVIEFSR